MTGSLLMQKLERELREAAVDAAVARAALTDAKVLVVHHKAAVANAEWKFNSIADQLSLAAEVWDSDFHVM